MSARSGLPTSGRLFRGAGTVGCCAFWASFPGAQAGGRHRYQWENNRGYAVVPPGYGAGLEGRSVFNGSQLYWWQQSASYPYHPRRPHFAGPLASDGGCRLRLLFYGGEFALVVQQRIAGLQFAGGLFTNLTHDHLDYHGTFDAYLKAKKGFFDSLPAASFALVNADDKNGPVMLQNCKARAKFFSLREIGRAHV